MQDPLIGDHQFRLLYSLMVDHLANETDWCDPKDKALGKSCAKGERTVQRITAELKAAGHINKKNATHDAKTRHVRREDPPQVGGTKTFYKLSIKPSLGSASPSPRDSAASASPGNHASLVAKSSFSHPSPRCSARPPLLPRGEGAKGGGARRPFREH
jgi:hypothetical protein